MDRAIPGQTGRAQTVPVIEEALTVETIAVDRGGYRITKDVSTRQEIVDELRHTHRADIERRPIGRELGVDELPPEPRYEGDTLIVPVVEETLVIQKRLLLVEEIRITRKRDTTRQPRTFTLRKEEVHIERLEADTSSSPETPTPPPRKG